MLSVSANNLGKEHDPMQGPRIWKNIFQSGSPLTLYLKIWIDVRALHLTSGFGLASPQMSCGVCFCLSCIHFSPRTSAKHSRHLRSPITDHLPIFVKRNLSHLFRFARSVRLLIGCASSLPADVLLEMNAWRTKTNPTGRLPGGYIWICHRTIRVKIMLFATPP